jgi:hypothetical protein
MGAQVQATGNGRADDPHAIVEDIPVPEERVATPPSTPKPKPKAIGEVAKAKSGVSRLRKKK